MKAMQATEDGVAWIPFRQFILDASAEVRCTVLERRSSA